MGRDKKACTVPERLQYEQTTSSGYMQSKQCIQFHKLNITFQWFLNINFNHPFLISICLFPSNDSRLGY